MRYPRASARYLRGPVRYLRASACYLRGSVRYLRASARSAVCLSKTVRDSTVQYSTAIPREFSAVQYSGLGE